MSVVCGIVGLPNVGKSTLFSAFTATPADRAVYPFITTEANVAIVNVPDERLETIRTFIEKHLTLVTTGVVVLVVAGFVALRYL